MKKVTVKVPGSCGEIIQGFYGSGEALVSYAIDCYSTVTLTPSSHYHLSINHHNEKAMVALRKACAFFDLDYNNLDIEIDSDIPVGKGMASSTADIVGVLSAVSVYAGQTPDPVWLGELAAQIEPTDNIMFKDWVLFDHLNGRVLEDFRQLEGLKVLVLEMDETIDTKALRKKGAFTKSKKPNPSNALNLLRLASDERSYDKLGEAMKTSAFENQIVLEKPHLAELTQIASEVGVIGINAAHSGTVLGVVYTEESTIHAFQERAQALGYLKPYIKKYIHNIIEGGPRITVE